MCRQPTVALSEIRKYQAGANSANSTGPLDAQATKAGHNAASGARHPVPLLFAPILMLVRMSSGDALAWEVGLRVILTVMSTLGLTWMAGRIYSNSVLRLGTRVRFRDAP